MVRVGKPGASITNFTRKIMEASKNNVAGIDVSAETLDLVVRKKGKNQKVKKFKNTSDGHTSLIEWLRKKNVSHVCLEATGIYHLDLAVTLDQTSDISVMVLNPRVARKFAEATMTRGKTDAIDAGVLAQYADCMDFIVWTAPRPIVLQIKAYSRRLSALAKLKVKTKNQLHALQATIHTPRQVIDDAVLTIAQLENQIVNLEAGALKLIISDEEINNVMILLISVKGIAQTTAIQLIGELLVLPKDMTSKQWVAYAGLDPRANESGKSVSKKRRISKAGNRNLRRALYMPALSASRHEVNVSAYYQHLINNRGITKLQAICAVMRKLLHAIHGMLKSGKSFDGTRFYVIPVES